MLLVLGLLLAAAPAQAAVWARAARALGISRPARPVLVRSIGRSGEGYLVNGQPAPLLGFGNFKTALAHPGDSELTVKVFDRPGANEFEQARESQNVRRLEASGAAPRLLEEGAGYLVQERVRGRGLGRLDPTGRRAVRRLLLALAEAGVELADDRYRENIMVGETRSGGYGAYLVDADVRVSGLSREQLRADYEAMFAWLDAVLLAPANPSGR